MLEDIREKLADQEHARWSRWMNYLFTKGKFNGDGSFTIESQSVTHWLRQVKTDYKDLTEKEKDSDRKEADNTLVLLRSVDFLKEKALQVDAGAVGSDSDGG